MKKRKLLTLLAMTTIIIAMAGGSALADLAPGVKFDFNANDPASGVDSANWNSLTADSSQDWDFGADVTLETVSSGIDITKAYLFTGGGGDDNPSFDPYSSTSSATWEFWIKPSDTGDAAQVIFETGANGIGMAIWYQPGTEGDNVGTINFTIDAGTPNYTISAEIDVTDFRQVTMVFDKDINGTTVDLMQIYIDGVLVSDNSAVSPSDIGDWSGGHGSGLGGHIGNICDGAQSGSYSGYISIFRFWEAKALTAEEVAGNYELNAGGYITVIYPENGAVVPLGDVTLLWENYNDPCSTSPVTVDVMWGTDPNRYTGAYTQAASGENVTSATISPAGPGVYYWYVDTTIGAGTADPCTLEGRVYMFTNDGPIESVDPIDMVTWVNEPVLLYPNVTDDGSSALTYNWTVSTPNGLTAVIDDATLEQPTVTFTKFPYAGASIINPSFEDTTLAGWTGGISMNTVSGYTSIPDGSAWIYIQPGQSASQVLYETVQEGATYTLSAAVGFDSRWGHTSSTYTVQLLAGSGADAVVLAEASEFMTDTVNFYNPVVTYTNDPIADADVINKRLQIKLICEAGSSINAFFDNVVLTSDQLFDPYMLPAELTVTVQDQTNPAATGTMTIEVYEDSCSAARSGLGLDIPSDYNDNCQVYFEDLATLAEAWLKDTSATDFVRAEAGPELAGKFGILDVTSTNPATGAQWAAGDQYRLAFVTSGTRDATDPSIATYNAFVQAAAEAAGFVGATWKCVAATYDNGPSNSGWDANRDSNVGRLETELPTYLLDGSKLWNQFLNGNLATTYSVTETGGSWLGNVATGAGRVLGDPGQTHIERGDSTRTGGQWWRVFNGLQTDQWHFYAVSEPLTVALPVADAGDKISTWLGKEVTMAPTVADPNYPTATFEYSWTASPDDDPKIDIVISDPLIEAPTVTVTKVPYLDPYVTNGSFENVTNQQWIDSSRDSWGHYDRPAGTNKSSLQYVNNPAYHFPDGITPDGNIMVRAASATDESRPDGPAILLEDVLYDPTATYELSVAVGHPHEDNPPNPNNYTDDTWRGYLVQLVVGGQVESTGSGPDNIYGGTVVAQDANSIDIPRREWRTSVVTLAPSPELDHLAGQPIQIRLLTPDDPDPLYETQTKVFFDNVILKINGAPGEMVTDPGMITVKMVLAANKTGETEIYSDRVMIDVYEDACETTKAVAPKSLDVTDHNIDCITNIADFVPLAKYWLLDYALIQAEPKPVE